MTAWKDHLAQYLPKHNKDGNGAQSTSASASTTSSDVESTDARPTAAGQDGKGAESAAAPAAPAETAPLAGAATPQTEEQKTSADVPTASASTLGALQEPIPSTSATSSDEAQQAASTSMSRSESSASGIARYKRQLQDKLPIGTFEIENATGVPLNVSLNQVGPLYYDIVKPGEVFTRTTGKVWFTIECRVHTGPASEYTKWSVAWPIMLVAGPSAAALSLACIPIAILMTGGAPLAALISSATSSVTSAMTYLAGLAGTASKLPFASKYKSRALTSAKSSANDAQAYAAAVLGQIKEKGGPAAYWAEYVKKRGGEPKKVEMPEQPLSVHDISDTTLAEVFDALDGEGPKGWKRKRRLALRQALKECVLIDRGWYAGREPVLRVTGGPRIVTVPHPLPISKDERERTILEFWPLRLEKVTSVGEHGVEVEEVARQEGKSSGVEETVKDAARAMEED